MRNILPYVGTLLLLLFAVGCSVGGNTGPNPKDRPDDTETPETSGASRDLRVEEIAAGAPGSGPAEPRVVVAPSARALSGTIDGEIPDRSEGTYLMAYWGEKPTGGYSLAARSARVEGDRITIELELKNPPEDAMLTQALTYPYVVAVVRGLDPRAKEFVLEDRAGKGLGWPVRRVDE